jgi:hypothetical protein
VPSLNTKNLRKILQPEIKESLSLKINWPISKPIEQEFRLKKKKEEDWRRKPGETNLEFKPNTLQSRVIKWMRRWQFTSITSIWTSLSKDLEMVSTCLDPERSLPRS